MSRQTKEYSSAASTATRNRKQLFIDAWKADRGCRDCSEHDPVVLDAHHIDPETKNPRLKGRGNKTVKLAQLSWDDIEQELLKCVVLCANCHRRETVRSK